MGEGYPITAGSNPSYGISRKCTDAVFALLNEAFGRNYAEGDILEMRPGRVMFVESDKRRRYEFVPVNGVCGNKMTCLLESETAHGFLGNKPVCNDDTLWLEICNIAVLRPARSCHGNRPVRCVIDSPGGVVGYAVSVVMVENSEDEFVNLLNHMYGE